MSGHFRLVIDDASNSPVIEIALDKLNAAIDVMNNQVAAIERHYEDMVKRYVTIVKDSIVPFDEDDDLLAELDTVARDQIALGNGCAPTHAPSLTRISYTRDDGRVVIRREPLHHPVTIEVLNPLSDHDRSVVTSRLRDNGVTTEIVAQTPNHMLMSITADHN